MLDIEKKHMFLNLEIIMSQIDGEFSDDEKRIIDTHCLEMHIDNNNYEIELPIDELLFKIKNSFSEQEKYIIFLELVATVLADGVYHDKEKNLIEKLAEILNIPNEDIDEAFSIINDMKLVYERCANYIQ
jgi:tellurite resistance protein